MIVAMFNRVHVVEMLIERGANPDARDANGVSILEAAERMGARDTAARLARSEKGGPATWSFCDDRR